MGFVSQLFASAIGGAVGGSFVLLGVNTQFRRQAEAALRALIVEVDSNAKIALEMTQGSAERQKAGAFPQWGPDPGWLKRSVWDSQLPYVVQVLDQDTLTLVSDAYGSLDPVSRMFYRFPDQPQGNWAVGVPVESSLNRIEASFRAASKALHSLQEIFDSQRWTTRARTIFETAKQKLLRN